MIRILRLCLWAVLFGLAGAVPGAAQDPRYFEAQRLIDAENWGAAETLARALEAEAADPEALLDAQQVRATLDFALGDTADALANLRAVDAGQVAQRGWTHPRRLPVLDMISLLEEDAGKPDAARLTYLRMAHIAIVSDDPATQVVALDALARGALADGLPREASLFATDLYDAAIQLGGEVSDAAQAARALQSQAQVAIGDPEQIVADDPVRSEIVAALTAMFDALNAQNLSSAENAATTARDLAGPEEASTATVCMVMAQALVEVDPERGKPWLDCTLTFPASFLAVRADLSPMLEQYADALAGNSDAEGAVALLSRALEIVTLQLGEDSARAARLLFRRAEMRFYLRHFDAAQQDIDVGLAVAGVGDALLRFDLQSLQVGLYLQRQDLPQAEAAFRAAADILRQGGLTEDARWTYLLSAMSDVQAQLGRLDEAETLAREAVRHAETRDPDTRMQMAIALGGVLVQQGRFDEAVAALESTKARVDEVMGKDEGVAVAWMLTYASVLRDAGRAAEADAVMAKVSPRLAQRPDLIRDPAQAMPILTALVKDAWESGDLVQAETYADDALAVLPEADPQRLPMLELKGRVAIAQNRNFDALKLFREVGAARLQPGRDALAAARNTLPLQIEAALRVAEESGGSDYLTYLDEAFRVSQKLAALSAGTAMAQAAARWETEPALARQVRDLQDAEDRIATLNAAYGRALARGESGAETATALTRATQSHAALQQAVARDYPRYAEAVDPSAVSVQEVARWLRPDEVLVIFATSDESNGGDYFGSTVIAVTQDRVMSGGTLARSELSRIARALRCQSALTDRACASARAGTRNFFTLEEDEDIVDPAADTFDLGLAHEAYTALLAPVEPLLEGKTRLIVVPDPSLVALPFHTLVRRTPEDTTTLRDAGWLLRDMSVFVVPTVASLDALRRRAPVQVADARFLGVGDPLIGAQVEGPLPYDCAGVTQSLAALDAVPEGAVMRGALADPGMLAKLAALPDTRCELQAAADFFGPESRLLLHGDATESRIKALDASGILSTFQTISFATHGLIAGEVGEFDAGIVLTPPKVATATDDGILTTGDIAQLTLNADMVLLSACNTAAGGGETDEGLSGLASAFFYAGARSILVSHWPVYSDAATALTTGMLARKASDARLGYADALRLVMLGIVDDPASDARQLHPAYWAPFMVVGEGAARP